MATTNTTTLGVRGFHCSGCADNVGKALLRLDGVIKVAADFDAEQVQVRYDPDRVTEDALRDQIRAAGFEPA